jgi:hypothetical protein
MTLDQFDKTAWTCGMKAQYHGDNKTYPVASCDFEERLIGLHHVVFGEPDKVTWVRCENVTLVDSANVSDQRPLPAKEDV